MGYSKSQSPETLLQFFPRIYYEMLSVFEQRVGMTRARWSILHHLFDIEHLSQAELQQRMGVNGAAVTRQVKQLEQDSLVTRRADPADNRFTLVALTTEGRRRVQDVIDRRDELEASILAGIPADDIVVLRRCLERIFANLRAGGESDTPGADSTRSDG